MDLMFVTDIILHVCSVPGVLRSEIIGQSICVFIILIVKAIQSCPTLSTPWTLQPHGHSMEFSRPEYWSG